MRFVRVLSNRRHEYESLKVYADLKIFEDNGKYAAMKYIKRYLK